MSEQVYYSQITGESVRNGNTGADGNTGGWVGGRWVPGSRPRATLHDVRMTRTEQMPEEAPQPVEVPQSYAAPYQYAPQQATTGFTQEGDNMAGNNHSETLDDLEDFDPFDREQMNALIERRVQAALAPSRQQQTDNELASQYNSTLAKFGSDSNFKAIMGRALEMCLADSKTGRAINIEKRYEEASAANSRQTGKALEHLPGRAKTVRGLGALIQHNFETGRARPYRGR